MHNYNPLRDYRLINKYRAITFDREMLRIINKTLLHASDGNFIATVTYHMFIYSIYVNSENVPLQGFDNGHAYAREYYLKTHSHKKL